MIRLTRIGGWVSRAAMGLCVAAAPAHAHTGLPPAPHDLWSSWSLDPWIVIPMVAAAVLYARGLGRLRRRAGALRGVPPWRAAAFAVGLLLMAVALISPLDALGSALFAAHMTQHEVMIVLAAPLLVLGRPVIPVLWALPPAWRRAVGGWTKRWLRAPWRTLTQPAVAFGLHAAAVLVWHVPALYQATLGSELVHALQHISFVGTALVFWWAMLGGGAQRRARYGAAVLCLFGTALYGTALGALLTFAESPWYPAYGSWPLVWGLTPLEDQQLGGLIMWIPAGLVHLPAALAFVALWAGLFDDERPRTATGHASRVAANAP
ncbi:MAG TPA: cytochrome c oxidase assembly protein [Gemmatimonadaceae bacterium]|nr:cytochrome c oxidase assembly protein [Gemmatimonadaceae bacterium]